MKTARTPELRVILAVHQDKNGVYARAVTWGMRDGVYGSLGSVRIPLDAMTVPEDQEQLARLLLTALYGGPYDL